MTTHPSDHIAIYATETAAMAPTCWDQWIDRVEARLGDSADGDIHSDGYSIYTFLDLYEADLTPEDAAERIVGAVFVTPDGTVYRLARAQRSSSFDPYQEKYDMLTTDGYHSVAYELPAAATQVWTPHRARGEG
jgi:hypothetical protein